MNENESTLAKKGGISVETAHIFPVIKKWLYSEKDTFFCGSWCPMPPMP